MRSATEFHFQPRFFVILSEQKAFDGREPFRLSATLRPDMGMNTASTLLDRMASDHTIKNYLDYLEDTEEYQSNLCIARPERSLGSNQVVFGGIMLPLSAMSVSSFIDTG